MTEVGEDRIGTGATPRPLPEFDEASLDTPNCAACLHRMDPAESPQGAVYWECPNCGATRVA